MQLRILWKVKSQLTLKFCII